MTGTQIHLFLSRSPLLFLLAALILFGLAWKKNQKDWETIGLIWTVIACLLVIPTYLSGSLLEASFPSEHDQLAKISIVIAVLTSILLIISLTFRQTQVSNWTKKLGLITALLTLFSLSLTNHYGALIRHGEPDSVSTEEEQGDEEEQEDREDPQRGNEV
jgi:4-amino-4-deoxy-L-arabinose transferase-like glycosyltransferase